MAPCYRISTTHNDTTCTYNYYPDGEGKYYRNYVTDYGQYLSKLQRQFKGKIYYLYYYNKNGEYEYIQDDEDLQGAFDYRRNGYDLEVSAVVYYNAYTTTVESSSESASTSETRTTSVWDETTTIPERKYSNQTYETIDDSIRGYDTSVIQIMKQFVKHKNVSCHHCSRKKWSGVRYLYYSHYGYSLCGRCHGELSSSKKRMWVCDELPWDGDAPAYPLRDGDRGSDVLHLQYLLTRLGFMPLSATDVATGYFQDNTENAIRSFQRRYGVRGDEDEYGRKTARKLAEVAKKRRRQGHQLI